MCNKECICNNPPRRIPFNLERALAGDPVITRDGKEVEQLTYFKDCYMDFPVKGVIAHRLFSWTLKGEYMLGITAEDDFDLFMKPKQPKKLWIAVCKIPYICDDGVYAASNAKPYDKLEAYHNDKNYVILPIELPEED